MIKIYIHCILLYLSCSFSYVCAQPHPDTTFLATAVQNSVKRYTQAVHYQTGLYNGSEYVEPEQTNEQHPFFISEDWVNGTVAYDGEVYENVPLLYDITSDKVITELHNANPLVLVPEKLTRFSLSGHTFERIQNETINNTLPRTGYYDVLYNGKTKVISLRQKIRQEKIESIKDIEIFFDERPRYFILKNGSYFPVKSKISVLKLLPDKKHELKHFASRNKLRFRKNREMALTRLAEFYDTEIK